MTREEAIAIIRREYSCVDRECDRNCGNCDLMLPSKEPILQAYKMAIEALKQEPCEDCVSRKAVRDTIFAECSGENLDIDFAKVMLLQRAIKAIHSVTPPEPKADVLDKIRAEMIEIQLIGYATVDGKRVIASRAVLQIIDKYRAEAYDRQT